MLIEQYKRRTEETCRWAIRLALSYSIFLHNEASSLFSQIFFGSNLLFFPPNWVLRAASSSIPSLG